MIVGFVIARGVSPEAISEIATLRSQLQTESLSDIR